MRSGLIRCIAAIAVPGNRVDTPSPLGGLCPWAPVTLEFTSTAHKTSDTRCGFPLCTFVSFVVQNVLLFISCWGCSTRDRGSILGPSTSAELGHIFIRQEYSWRLFPRGFARL